MGGTRGVDDRGSQTTPGTPLIIWSCDGRPTQMWRQNSDGSITGARSGSCLDVNESGTANGTAVILWTCNGQSNQKWSVPTPPPGSRGVGPWGRPFSGGAGSEGHR